jgi:predicted transcriptional regulator
MKRQTTMRLSDATRTKLDELTRRHGTATEVVAVAIDRMYREENTMETTDRVQQVNWLRELAYNISQNLGEGTPEELVEYALSDEGRESWGIEIPSWFDDHDRGKLIEWVAENLE